MTKKFEVALEGDKGVSGVGPAAYLEREPDEGDEIVLEDGTLAIVKYMSTGKQGQPVVWAKRVQPRGHRTDADTP